MKYAMRQAGLTPQPFNPVFRSPAAMVSDKQCSHWPQIRRQGNTQVMHFGLYDVQSEMDALRPSALLLSYTQTMMAFLLVNPAPKRILMIGLGGGSMLKFCRRHLPKVDITVIEINSAVIALREDFQIPSDDRYLRIIHADGAEFVRGAMADSFDAILVDGFFGDRMPSALGSSPFYFHCQRLLTHSGVLACNLHSCDSMYETYRQRLNMVFEPGAVFSQCEDVGNRIAFASKDVAFETRLHSAGHPDHGRPGHIKESIWREVGFAMTCVLAGLHINHANAATSELTWPEFS